MAHTEGRSGQVLVGRYRLQRVLGRGGMGTVWAARDQVLGRDVAVKEVLAADGLAVGERRFVRYRTLREARAAARISHACAMTVHDVIDEDDRLWIVMEKLDAPSLDEVLQEGRLPPARVVRIGRCLVDALGAAHAAGVLHRDVKPANVMLVSHERAVLTDFGIATVEGDPELTGSGLVLGSPAYMAPERARGEPPTSASDLWSLGATLYAAVEGRPPFQRKGGALPSLTALISAEPAPAAAAGALAPVIARLLRKAPGERPTVAQTRSLLERAGREMAADRAGHAGAARLAPAGTQAAAIPRPASPQQVDPAAATRSSLVTRPIVPVVAPRMPPTSPPAPSGVPGQVGPPARPTNLSPGPVSAPDESPDEPPAEAPAERRAEPHAAPPPAGLAPGARRRGRLILLATSVTLVAAVTLWGLNARSDDKPGRTPSAAPGAGRTPAPSEQSASEIRGTSTGTAAPGVGPGASAGADPTAQPRSRAAAVPAGFRLVKDPSGFRVAIPDGWTRSRIDSRTYFKEPGGRRFLQVDQTTDPKPDALTDWQRQEQSVSQRLSGYRRIGIRRIDYRGWNAADWEFSWQPGRGRLHVLSRNIRVSDRRAYALYWSTPSEQWASSRRHFATFAATFQPAGR